MKDLGLGVGAAIEKFNPLFKRVYALEKNKH
jgi:hypothetical protein